MSLCILCVILVYQFYKMELKKRILYKIYHPKTTLRETILIYPMWVEMFINFIFSPPFINFSIKSSYNSISYEIPL